MLVPALGLGGPLSPRRGPSRWPRPGCITACRASDGARWHGSPGSSSAAARRRNLGPLGEARRVLLPMGRSRRRAGRA